MSRTCNLQLIESQRSAAEAAACKYDLLEENPEIQIPIILGSGKGLIIRISSAIARKTHIDA